MSVVLSAADVRVEIARGTERLLAVTDVSIAVGPGEALGIVGESGSGKSLTLRAVADVLPPGAKRVSGDVRSASGRTAMVFQEPMAALNPVRRIGDAIADVVQATDGSSRRTARERARQLLRDVGMTDPDRRARMWPHELSGGLRQRAMIAMALAHDPDVLLCDEPTTALDVTVQDQILGLLDRLRRERGTAIVFVTHDLAVVASLCQRIVVMYAGQIVEAGGTADVLRAPRHPYTVALLESSRTRAHADGARPIGGAPPDPADFGTGCRFADRCPLVQERCRTTPYRLAAGPDGREHACVRVHDQAEEAA